MQAAAGRADARREQILDGGLTILLLERDAPLPLRVLLADGRQAPREWPQDPAADSKSCSPSISACAMEARMS